MSRNDSLGDRMKRYELPTRTYLTRRMPVIIRIDGKAFHTWTKRYLPSVDIGSGSDDPFNETMSNGMRAIGFHMIQQAQNVVLCYSQSDEISILLRDWDKHETEQWFDGNIQKIASVSASIATAAFNCAMQNNEMWETALFDSRVFNIPKEEVTNYFIWRQQDATRNSIQMYGRHFFSHKEMHGKNVSEVQDMLMAEHGKNWNDLDVWKRRGFCVVPNPNKYDSSHFAERDDNIPIFTQDREYVERFLEPEEDLTEKYKFRISPTVDKTEVNETFGGAEVPNFKKGGPNPSDDWKKY